MLGKDSSSCGTCWWGKGRPEGEAVATHVSLESLCSSYSAQGGGVQNCSTRHTKATQFCCEPQPHLPALACPGPREVDTGAHTRPLPSAEDKKPGVSSLGVQPKTYHRHHVVLNTSEARRCWCYHIHSQGYLKLSLQCPRLLQLRACGLQGPVGVGFGALVCSPGSTSHGLLGPVDKGPLSSFLNFQDL